MTFRPSNVNVLSAEFAATQSRFFEEDVKRSKLVTYEEWKKRPWHQKLSSWLAVRFRREF